ncbi:MAG: PIG-L family deacetylase [Hungatella sp.]|jgi:LmbE family N-acetylglucosaminyl deacetylase|nr:PIG-L family deacetylase [Hungatella sp.]MDR2025465.1 PIG-L family deacetylase [Hungatella sp.]
MKVLVIATHIDDEVLGCGGTIKKHTKAGDEVYVVFISSQSSKRFNEELINTRKLHAKKAAKVLGIREIFFADHPLIMLDTVPQLDIVTSLERIIFEIKPEVLYCHYDADMNSDHRIVSQAAMVWCRPSKAPFLKKVLLYEIFAATQKFYPNYYVDISNEIEEKLAALSVYTTENNAQTRTMDTTRLVARYRGAEINMDYAEAFYVYREIV